MMKKVCLIIAYSIVSIFFVWGEDTSLHWVERYWTKDNVTIKLQIEKQDFAIINPINIYISANNQSIFPVAFFLTGNVLHDFSICLYKKENKQIVPFSEVGKKLKKENVISGHFEKIIKGKLFQKKIDISKLFTFESNTEYLMSIEGNITIGITQETYYINNIPLRVVGKK
jgi:predicted nucleotidyltransferase